jgi:hypothetical protein
MSLDVPLHDALHEKQAPHSLLRDLFSRQGPSILVPDCCTWGLLAAISTAANKRFIVAGDVTTVSLTKAQQKFRMRIDLVHPTTRTDDRHSARQIPGKPTHR